MKAMSQSSAQSPNKVLRRRLPALMAAALAGLAMYFQGPEAVAGPPIGINVGWVNDWHAELIFADAQKQARLWNDGSSTVLTNVDSNGWPLQDCQSGLW